MRISIVGWYGKNNVGDEAFRYVLGEFFKGHEVEFVTPPNRCDRPEIVVLGGGAVASPFYLETLPDCPRYALGIDLAYESEADLLAKANFREICVRTKTDAEALLKKVSCPVHAIPDLAYYIQLQGVGVLGTLRPPTDKPAIGIFATDYVLPAIDRPISKFANRGMTFVVGIARELDILARQGYEIVLVPCSTGGYGNDIRVNLDIAAHMKEQPTVIMETLTPHDMVELIADLNVAVCMRFHAHIFSMIAGTPLVSIEFTRKVKLWLKEQGLEDCTAVTSNDSSFHWDGLREKIKAVDHPHNVQEFHRLSAIYHDQLCDLKKRVRRDWLGEVA